MKLGLGVYQVIWYPQKYIVRGVKHVLKPFIKSRSIKANELKKKKVLDTKCLIS